MALHHHFNSTLSVSFRKSSWQARDPLPNAERLQGPNLYEYVGNNPTKRTDPLGLDYMVCTLAGHAYATVWDNQGNQTTFNYSPIEGWRGESGPPPAYMSATWPVLYYPTTPQQDQQLLDAFNKKVNNQSSCPSKKEPYNPFTHNCWQALGQVANPILNQ
jgi:hypothetical protein